ncbi:hypothetical protein B0H13DRAFT_1871048 [Mycena leptocephala]|nr:hypothetical protein B0H13DRAFT_1871048 [Mycena leptocephala]
MSATQSSRRATVMEVDDIDPMDFRKAPPLLDPSGPILESLIPPEPAQSPIQQNVFRRATAMEVDNMDPMDIRNAPPLLDSLGPALENLIPPDPPQFPFQQNGRMDADAPVVPSTGVSHDASDSSLKWLLPRSESAARRKIPRVHFHSFHTRYPISTICDAKSIDPPTAAALRVVPELPETDKHETGVEPSPVLTGYTTINLAVLDVAAFSRTLRSNIR